MRKTVILSLSLLILAVGCQLEKKEPLQIDDYPQFVASTEVFTHSSKTSMTPERQGVWSEDDRVAVFQGSTIADEYVISPSSVGMTNAVLTIVRGSRAKDDAFFVGTELNGNVAYYPYSLGLSLIGSAFEENVNYLIDGVVLPEEQEYAANSFANGSFPMVAVTETLSDHNLKFKNVLGAIKFKLKGTKKIMSIELKGNNDERLSGEATIIVAADNGVPTINMSAESKNSVVLDCGDGVQLDDYKETEFILAIPPTDFKNGFSVVLTDSKNNVTNISTKAANAVYRSSILVMPTVTVKETSNGETEDVNKGEDVGINK